MATNNPHNSPDLLIWIIATRLSDGGKVYAVELPGGHKIDAVDEDAAMEMADAFVEAINEHSNVTAGTQMGVE